MENEAPEPGAPQPETTAPTPLDMPQQQPDTTAAAQDITSLPDWAQKVIGDARAEAAKSRTQAKQNAADEARKAMAADVARALGIQTDEAPDPAQLTAQLEDMQHQVLVSAVENAVLRTAAQVGADAARLLDSRAFEDTLAEHVDVGPTDPQFASQVEAAIKAAVAAHPEYKTQPAGQVPTRSSAPITGGSGDGIPITEAQLAQMTPSQIAEALNAGRLQHLL